MDNINNINRYRGIYTDYPKNVKETSKDERNRKRDNKKNETFKDVFEKTQKKEKK